MFERRPVPTPFQVDPVNVYVAARTIVDPGPETDEAWAAVRSALADRDLEPADVERVLVTHPHPDHCGLARRFRDRGADVLASPETAAILADFGGRLEYEQSYFRTWLPRHGMPEETASTIADLTNAFRRYVSDCDVDRVLTGGDEVAVGPTTLTTESVTGHAPGELLFSYRADGDRAAIVGDHVLGRITPNPLLQPPAEPGGDRPRILPAYNDSLERLRDRSFDRFLPGHGDVIDRPTDRIDAILAAHEDRTDAVLDLLDGPTTAYEVMEGLFDDLSIGDRFGGMSEAVGHLDVLEQRDRVRRREHNHITYEPV